MCVSVFRCKHDREHARRLVGVRGIRRTKLHRLVVVVDLPQHLLAVDRERAKVVLTVGIVVFRESVELGYPLEDHRYSGFTKALDTLRGHDLSTLEGLAEVVVECADFGGLGLWHGGFPWLDAGRAPAL